MPPKRMRDRAAGPKSRQPPTQACSGSRSEQANGEGDEAQAQLSYLQEVAWCLDRLEALINKKGASSKQVEEARKAWKTLSNPNSPLVSKRQTMRMMFGNYRQKMEEEEKQFSLRPQGMTISQVTSDKAPKSKYLRPSSHTAANSLSSTTKNFEFGFHISEESKLANGESDFGKEKVECEKSYCNVQSANKSFTFNFDIASADT